MDDSGQSSPGEPHRCRPVGRLGGVALALLLSLAPALGDAEPPAPRFPLALQDPESAASVEVDAGAPVLHLVFFATWCPPCVEELPRLAEIEARWGEGGYRLVIVAVQGRQSLERLARYARDERPPGRLLFDSSDRVRAAFDAERIPAHVLVNADGEVILRAPALEPEVEETIERLVVRHVRERR